MSWAFALLVAFWILLSCGGISIRGRNEQEVVLQHREKS